ncbi:ADP-specific Phosphofructokinase/Glucokinase conserved region [Necator americanus]|uniref:ADP-specific Phosphofructokinase/Glucokinase conserved region n=1 Tax=Necator americanus TaxID=51031 RepID=W2SLT9_NECAM|nr:ADP-specific Phosphofructokinase/Glucokinase conserved region [Necator americanus]ETN69811.1 ADP-specific Phosphofructokinase/Glucokinase conserved region [Necator americanus]
MSARNAMAAMLDELMGPKRNVELGKDTKVTFDDPDICKYYIVGFCPHDMFVNTKADLGACPRVHDDNLRLEYPKSDKFEKLGFEREFLKFLSRLDEDNQRRIRKNLEKLKANEENGQKKEDLRKLRDEQEIARIDGEIKACMAEAEKVAVFLFLFILPSQKRVSITLLKAGEEGLVTKCQELVEKIEQLEKQKAAVEERVNSNTALPPPIDESAIKVMEVCEVCGSMLIKNDAQCRVEEHLSGKMHMGFSKIKVTIEELRTRENPSSLIFDDISVNEKEDVHVNETAHVIETGVGGPDRVRVTVIDAAVALATGIVVMIAIVATETGKIVTDDIAASDLWLALRVVKYVSWIFRTRVPPVSNSPLMRIYLHEQHQLRSYSVERAMSLAWDRAIAKPGIPFRRAVVGFNCNVDVIVSGIQIIENLNTTCEKGKDHESLETLDDLHETFVHFFQRGAPAERYMSSESTFETVVRQAEAAIPRAQYHIGGNAALMAERIASGFPSTEVYLVGPIGPRSQALLNPSVRRTNSTRITKTHSLIKDELHVIMEYKQGETLGDWIAPSSSRFITSHDHFSGSTVVMEMFFKAIAQFKPDLIILSGIHTLEFHNKEMRLEKLRMIRRNLLQISSKTPIHFELGSLADATFMFDILHRIIPHVDSLGINEQELAFLSHVAGGPHMEEYPVQAGTVHAHKVVEMLDWLLKTFGRDRMNPNSKNFGYRLQRIHFQCLTYQMVVSSGNDWSNLASGLAASSRLAGRMACNLVNQARIETDLLEVRTAPSFILDKKLGKMYNFHAHNPIASWMRDQTLFIFTPVLVCKFPMKTVGVDDAISTTGLLYSQFYRFDSNMKW